LALKNESSQCPKCGLNVEFEKYKKNEELYFYCPDCEYLIKANIPNLELIKEIILFLLNSTFLLSIPFLSLYFYEFSDKWDKYLPFIFLFSASILSVAFHEYFHALTAFILGDKSIFAQNYLRFDIRKYFFSITSLLLPFAVFLLTGIFLPGAAVFFDRNTLNNRLSLALVFISGVLANLLIFFIIIYFLGNFPDILSEQSIVLLHTLAFIHIIIFVFNLLPIPPLDGWGVLSQVLNDTIINFFDKLGFFIFVLIFGVGVYFDLFDYLYPIYFYILSNFNLSSDYIYEGIQFLVIIDPQEIKSFADILFKKLSFNH